MLKRYFPVGFATYEEAVAFCKKQRKLPGLTLVHPDGRWEAVRQEPSPC